MGTVFALGGDGGALRKTLVAATTGSIAAAFVMVLGPPLAGAPQFWGVALAIGLAGPCWFSPRHSSTVTCPRRQPPLPAPEWFLLWWCATGLDNYVHGGKGPHTVATLAAALTARPLAAGTGAFGGLLSTPWPWVAFSVWVTLVCGALLGVASGSLAALAAPRRERQPTAVARFPHGLAT